MQADATDCGPLKTKEPEGSVYEVVVALVTPASETLAEKLRLDFLSMVVFSGSSANTTSMM